MKLPHMELPKFDGTIGKWNDFEERFTNLVDSNPRLLSIEKMHYLKECLVGEAIGAVRNLSLSQYTQAWESLKGRYQNKKVLTFDYLKKLFMLPCATENSASLRSLIDAVKSVRS